MSDRERHIPERLPLLDAFLVERAGDGRPLQGVTALLVQHHTGSIVAMLGTLVALGLEPARTFLVDIPYSTHPSVIQGLRTLGVPAANVAEMSYRLGDPLRPYQLDRVGRILDQVRQRVSSDDRLLVLDDGAYVVDALSRSGPLPGRLAVVEQTVFGMRMIREQPEIAALCSRLPLVDVADSRPKKTIEAAFLGSSIANVLSGAENVLKRLQGGNTLILGYGAIGRAVARALRSEVSVAAHSIFVGDPSVAARDQARRDGFTIWSRHSRKRFDVVIGCSGRNSFRPEDVRFVSDQAVLASASSGTIEFSRDAIFELCASVDEPRCFLYGREPLSARSLHDDLRIRLFDRDVLLLNGGYPVDFDGSVNGAAGHLIQLTRTLMVGGALQAFSAEPGVHALTESFIEWIERRFQELVAVGPA